MEKCTGKDNYSQEKDNQNRIYAPNTTQIPNVILDHWMHILKHAEFKVLLVICRKTFGWHKQKDMISSKQICQLTGLGKETVRCATRKLEKLGLIICHHSISSWGDPLPNSFEINVYNLNNTLTCPPILQGTPSPNSQGDLPQPTGTTKPTNPKPTNLTKGNAPRPQRIYTLPSDSDEKALPQEVPFYKINKGNGKALEGGRKFPRKLEEQKTFEWLQALELDTDEKTLSYWAHKYPRSKLEDTYCHYLYKLRIKNFKPKSPGAIFRKLLEEEGNPVTEASIRNREYAMIFQVENKWHSLEVKDRYCVDSRYQDRDLSFTIEEETFKERIKELYEYTRRI